MGKPRLEKLRDKIKTQEFLLRGINPEAVPELLSALKELKGFVQMVVTLTLLEGFPGIPPLHSSEFNRGQGLVDRANNLIEKAEEKKNGN